MTLKSIQPLAKLMKNVVVWDKKSLPFSDLGGDIILWSRFANDSSSISLPTYLEDHGEYFRAKYLAFVHDLGVTHVNGKSVIDILESGDGFSFWWMTLLAEKSPIKSIRIYDCLRLFALEEILLDLKPDSLFLVTSDPELVLAIKDLCLFLSISFSKQLDRGQSLRLNLRRLFDSLPHFLQALIFLLHYVGTRWKLTIITKGKWFSNEKSIFIASYFVHLDSEQLSLNRFYSFQWENLPHLIAEKGFNINWLQHYCPNSILPSPRTTVDCINQLNRDPFSNGYHELLDGYLSTGVIVCAVKRWVALLLVSWNLRSAPMYFYPSDSRIWLWPFLKYDWMSSLVGITAIMNCLFLELFDALMSDIPHQKFGFYLCENQGWERALLHTWRKHGHGVIIGVPHSTTPFWHLYYHDDKRTINSVGSGKVPLPDKLAVNGPLALKVFLESGYTSSQLHEVEALRYNDLLSISPVILNKNTSFGNTGFSYCSRNCTNVLIVGDYIFSHNQFLFELLQASMITLSDNFRFTFKPHPALDFDVSIYSDIVLEKTYMKLSNILTDFDIVLSTNSTSASLDAYLCGLTVLVCFDGSTLNLSPLRRLPGVHFVKDSKAMLAIFTKHEQNTHFFREQRLFWLNKDLHRWACFVDTFIF